MVSRHPYRPELASHGRDDRRRTDVLEEHLLALLLVAAGGLGIAIGLTNPTAHPNELTLGLGLLGLCIYTIASRRSTT